MRRRPTSEWSAAAALRSGRILARLSLLLPFGALLAAIACGGHDRAGPPQLRWIAVDPGSASIAKGLTEPFTATGHYSDGSTRDLTATAAWTSSDDGVATVTNGADGTHGVATGGALGTATLTAAAGGLSGQATLTVTPPVLQSIAVAPVSAPLAQGSTRAFTAKGTYSDASTQDLTAVATWTSSDLAVATVTSTGTRGVATGVAVGQATLTAAYGGLSGEATLTVTAAALQSIEISPATASIAKGLTQACTATGHYSDGSIQDLTAVATWSSSDLAVATISNAADASRGTASGVAVGQATLTASYSGFQGQATLTVTPPVLQAIAVTPGGVPMAKGLTQAFAATGQYSDGSNQDLTDSATWSSSDPAVAIISNVAGSRGLATTLGVGQATITAAYGGLSGQATLTVTAAVLQSIAVAPAPASIAKGLTQAFLATGSYSDGSTQDLTAVASWSSSDVGVATVSNAAGAGRGVGTGTGIGSVTVTATYAGCSGQAVLTVTAPVVQSVALVPASASVAKGLAQAFTVTGSYSDGSSGDLTLLATWTSSDPSIATISSAGVATGAGEGQATVTASYSGLSGQAVLTVTAPALQSIAIAPAIAPVAQGLSQALAATGQYSDGSTQDLTAAVTWSSSDDTVATVSNAAETRGVATGVGTGSAVVTGALGGLAGQATVTVTPPALQSIAVAPVIAPVAKGLTQAFTATGHYSDGSTQDLTTVVTWSSSDAMIASISNADGSRGIVTGVAAGALTITASYGGRSGQATVTVTAATLQSIAVAPAVASIAKGVDQAFTATGQYSDGSTQDLTAVATWSSSDASVASVSNVDGGRGVATGAALGTATITATYGGRSGQGSLTVTAPALQSITVAPGTAPLAKGLTQLFTATGHYSDGSTQDLTESGTWSSSDPAVATVSNAAGGRGVATGVAAGQATLAVAYGGRSGQAALTVTAAALQSVAVTPGGPSIATGLTQAFVATGNFSDGTTLDLTAVAAWTSSDVTVAAVSNAADDTHGVATGVAPGQATIDAAYGGRSGQATLTVTPAALMSIAVAPDAASIAEGLTQALTVTGRYSDGSTQDLTAAATWASSDLLVASVSNDAGTQGFATAVGIGDAVITASYGGRSGQALLTVRPPALQSIAVAPPSASVPRGLTQLFTATGRYSDGSTQDLTVLALWSSSDVAVASVSGTGVATGVQVGAVTLFAAYDGQVGAANLAVTAPVLQSIAVSPAVASVPSGLTQAFTAMGEYSDGSSQDLTAVASWSSTDLGVASVAGGAAKGTGTGTATIAASYDGRAGSATLSVTAPVLQSLAIAPTVASTPAGLTAVFSAIGTYSDGSTQDLTLAASWSSSDLAVATVSSGVASGVAIGQATLVATYDGQLASAIVDVIAPTLQSITVSPQAISIAKGLTQAFTATGHYSDGSTQALTGAATWSSSDLAVATVSNASGSQGVATGVGTGSALVTATAGGRSGEASLTVAPPVLQSVTVAPGSASIAKGLTNAYTATGHYSDGSTQDLTATASWTSSDVAIATVSGGVATGVALGTATITAASGGRSGQAALTVTAATIQSIAVAPGSASIAKGQTQAFTATAQYSDGSTGDVTGAATWTTGDAAVATLAASIATGVGLGTTSISAAYGGTAGAATLTVTPAVVVAVSLSPSNATIAAGTTQQYDAVALYSDDSKQDVTGSATWSSSNPAVATVSTAGIATGVASGSASLSAVFSGVTGAAPITVTNATLSSITVSPANPVVPKGVTQPFVATGVFSDGTKQDLTTQVTWTSSDGACATISAAGVATTLSAGNPTIRAARGGVFGETILAVTTGTLVSIDVTPPAASIAKGTTIALTATGNYSDGSAVDLTAAATWSSSDPSVAISNAAGTKGVATGASVGSSTVTATFDGISGTATVTVTSAVLTAMAVTPSGAVVPQGLTQQLTATGSFSDGTTQDLTAAASWSSSSPTVASVSNASGSEGLVTAMTPGAASITASYAGITGSAPLTVSSTVLQSIQVLPSNAKLPGGYTLQYQAIATYSNGSTYDLTTQATWTSSNTAVATISNAAGTQGLATSSAVATNTAVTISATLNGKTGSTTLTVTTARLSTLAVAPAAFTIGVGGTEQLIATGTFNDGTTLDITRQCNWTSSARSVATVSKSGLVTGVSAGTTTITARKTNKSATSNATVQ